MPAVIDLAFEPLVRLGDLGVRLPALIIALAVLVALLTAAILTRRERSRPTGLAPLRLDDLLYVTLSILPGAIIGGRIVYALGYLDHYGAQPMQLFDVSRGGFSLLGAVVGGTLAGVYIASLLEGAARRWAEAAAVPMLLAIGIGKVGQFLGGGGQGVFWDGPWAVSFNGAGPWQSVAAASPAHPVALYEAIWAFVGVAVVAWGARRLRSAAGVGKGAPFVVALGWFLLGRLILGAFYRDERLVGPLNVEQTLAALALAVVVAAVSIGVLRRSGHATPAPAIGALPAVVESPAASAASVGADQPSPARPLAVDGPVPSPGADYSSAARPSAVDGSGASPRADHPG